MNVNEAIIRFKNGCCLPVNRIRRMLTIEQYQTNVWEIKDSFGLIRIYNSGKEPKIVAYLDNYAKRGGKPFESDISSETYFELVKLYKQI